MTPSFLAQLPQDIAANQRAALQQASAPPATPVAQWPGAGAAAVMGSAAGLTVSMSLRMNPVPTAVAHLLTEQTPLVRITISNDTPDTRQIAASCIVDELSWEAIRTGEVEGGQELVCDLLPTFRAAALSGLTTATRASLRVRVDDRDARTTFERTLPIWMAARDTAFLTVLDPATGRAVDVTRYLAAWVTPSAPPVLDLLRAAAGHLAQGVSGYQGDVEPQVNAIFVACQQAGIQYVHSVFAHALQPGVGVAQRVRLPSETIAVQSGNCIDGTVLFASLLEAASLQPAIVLLPGHAIVGWRRTPGSADLSFLETTHLDATTFDEARSRGDAQFHGHKALADQTPGYPFRLHLVDELRRTMSIMPME